MTSATEAFEAGLLALGFTVRGDREPPDQRMARKVLAAASRADAVMADAWLARLAAGDRSLPVYEGLWRCRHRLGAALARYGLAPQDLSVGYESGMLVNAPLKSADAAAAAYVTALCGERRFDDAAAVSAGELGVQKPLTTYAAAALYYRTERWPQVVEAAATLRDLDDPVIAAAARALAGHAQTHLGLYKAAIAAATDPADVAGRTISEILPAAAATVAYFSGLCYRALGQESEAAEAFRTALVADPTHAAARDMLDHPDLQLVTTDQSIIDSRTDPWDPATAADPAVLAREHEAADRERLLAEADAELDMQVGLEPVKLRVKKLRSSLRMNKARIARGLPAALASHHLVFSGPPGTGKSTVADVVAKIYCGLSILSTTKVVVARRDTLVAGTLGGTALKTNAVIDSALDGVLIIDEVYTLLQQGLLGGDAFGREAIDTLLARMELDRHRLVVIIAGYEDEVDRFLAGNAGLASRFPTRISFASYSSAELVQIARVLAGKTQFVLDDAAAQLVERACAYLIDNDMLEVGDSRIAMNHYDHSAEAGLPGTLRRMIDVAGNGRFVRNVVEAAVLEQMDRLAALGDPDDLDDDTMNLLIEQDVRPALTDVIRAALSRDVPWEKQEVPWGS